MTATIQDPATDPAELEIRQGLHAALTAAGLTRKEAFNLMCSVPPEGRAGFWTLFDGWTAGELADEDPDFLAERLYVDIAAAERIQAALRAVTR